jgi:hypothetical protein
MCVVVAGIASASLTRADAPRPHAHVLQPDGRAALLGTAARGRASRQMLQVTLLGGTARALSCTCAPFESVRARDSTLTPRRVFSRGVRWCLCVRVCVRVCLRACMRASACVRACKCVCAWGCEGPPVARRRPAVFIARRAGGRVCALCLSPRSGRRCVLDEPYDECAVCWPKWAHVRDRRTHARHLRHRRLQRLRFTAHLLQRRPGEQRRRCGPDSRRGWSGVLGVLRVLAGYSGVPTVLRLLRLLEGHPKGHPWASMGYFGSSRTGSLGTYLR